MNVDIFILARLASKRLPAKQLKKIGNKQAIKLLVDRLRIAKKIRNIIVCTTNLTTDDPLIEFFKKEKILFFRGSEKDVLTRMLDAANHYQTDVIIDVEGDKIYTDPIFVDKVVDQFDDPHIDFVIGSNEFEEFDPTDHFVHGIIPSGFRKDVLEKACRLKTTTNTETGYKEIFLLKGFCNVKFIALETKLESSREIRLSLDYPEDLELAKIIVNELGYEFHFYDLIELFTKKPELRNLTKKILTEWEMNYKKNLMDIP